MKTTRAYIERRLSEIAKNRPVYGKRTLRIRYREIARRLVKTH